MSKKQTELTYEHLNTKINIKGSNICLACPYRIYNTDQDTVVLGAGNIHSNFIFILPTYDTKSKLGYNNLISMLHDAYKTITDNSLFDDVYTTRLVKCNKRAEFDLYTSAIGPCSSYLIYELNRLGAKNIIFFGNTYDDYISNCTTVGNTLTFKNIHSVYSPAVLLYDNSKIKNKFIEDLTSIIFNN